MKSWKLMVCAGLLALTGCTGTTGLGSASTGRSAAEKQDAATEQSDSAARDTSTTDGSDAMTGTADKIHKGFKDAGFTISDYEAQLHETSFDATNGTSFLGVDVDYIQNVRSAYDHAKNDNDVTVEDEYTSENKVLCVLRDLEDNTYELLAADEKQDLLVEVDEIQPENLGTVKHILALAGFPAE